MLPKSIKNLIDHFASLPGIGPKSAERLTFYLLRLKQNDLSSFANSIRGLKEKIKFCSICTNFAETDPCHVCIDEKRNKKIICVVAEPLNVYAFEKTSKYNGLYHVLHGYISPIDGIGPEDLTIDKLLKRISKEKPEEIILATNPTLEGEATSMYISKLISPLKIKITRIARGLPMGGDVEYADEVTLSKALEGRRDFISK